MFPKSSSAAPLLCGSLLFSTLVFVAGQGDGIVTIASNIATITRTSTVGSSTTNVHSATNVKSATNVSSSSKTNVGAIAAAVVGWVVALALAAVLGVFIFARRRRRRREDPGQPVYIEAPMAIADERDPRHWPGAAGGPG